MTARGSDQVFHVSLDARITSRDVEKVSRGVGPGLTNVIEIHLRPRGAARMEALTSRNVGGRLAIVIDRELVFAPVIRATIGGRVQVDGLGEAEARRIYESLNGGRLVARQRLFPRRR
jgi:preprotein translocase subunit SecD